jgi:predicted nucleic-acid-binding protein
MFGLDTNILIRLWVRDDERQAAAARNALAQAVAAGQPLRVSLLTLLETEWVLRSRYHCSKESLLRVFKMLLESRDVIFDDEAAVEQALYLYENSRADFAECLMIARYRQIGCDAMLTFDSRAAQVPGGKLLAA